MESPYSRKAETGMKFFLFFVSLLFILSSIYLSADDGSGIVRGTVTDSTNGEPIAYANLIIDGTRLGTATNALGYYTISGIEPGSYTLKVSYLGYQTKSIEFSVAAGEIQQFDIQLAPTSIQLQEFSVVGNRINQLNEVDLGLQKITIREIEMQPKGLETDVLRILRTNPGISATGDVTARYYVRGSGSDQNLVLLNGATVYNPFHALGIFSVIDPEMINSMEIHKGGFTAEYGGRLSSILNLTTKDGNKKSFQGSVSGSFLSGKAAIQGPIPNGSFIITGRKSYFSESLKKFIDYEAPFDFYDMSFKINYQNDKFYKNGKFLLHGFTSNDKVMNNNPNEEDYTFSNNIVGLNWYQIWADPLYSEMYFSLSMFDGEVIPNQSEAKPRVNEVVDFTSNWNFTYIFESRDELGLGIQNKYVSTYLDMENLTGGKTIVDQQGLNMVLFAKYKYKRFERFGIDVGTRINISTISKASHRMLEPRASFTYSPVNGLSFKGAYGSYQQDLVTLADENELISIFEPWIAMPEYLAPSFADHYVFGVDITVLDPFTVTLEGYYKDMQYITEVNPEKFSNTDPDFISVDGESYGFEALLQWQTSDFFIKTSYSLSWAYKIIDGEKYAPRYDSRHQVNLLAGVHIGWGWQISANWSLATGMPFTPIAGYYDKLQINDIWSPWYVFQDYNPYLYLGGKNSERLPVYHRLDLSLSKKFTLFFTDVTFDASVVNVYDRKNIFYFERDTGERVNMLPFMPSMTLKMEI